MSGIISAAASRLAAELSAEQSQAKQLWARLRANEADASMIVIGDSTGNESTEWVYLTAQWLAAKVPTHTVIYRTYLDGSGWAAPVTIQTGSGSKKLYVDNASVAGTNTFYAEGGREASIWAGRDYDLCVISYGHNMGTDTTEEIALPEFIVSASNARLLAPRAGLMVTLQNPRTSLAGAAQSARMVNAWRKVADLLGAGVIDAYSAFKSASSPGALYLDETHPSAAGQAVWLAQVKKALADPGRYSGPAPGGVSPFTQQRPNFIINARFSDWPGAAPAGWTFTSCTAAKTTGITEGGMYALQVNVGAGLSPVIEQDLSSALPKLRGKTVTLLARVYRPAGLDLLAGRVGIVSTDNIASSASEVSYPRGAVSAGGWEWAMVSLDIPRGHTSLKVTIYAGAANGSDSGKRLFLDHVMLCEGVLPGAVGFEDTGKKFVGEFYAGENVGLVGAATGTLSAVGTTITLSGASSTASDTYINLPGLTPGKAYRISWGAGTCTGNVGGGIYVRNGNNGGSTTAASTNWAAGSAGSYTFTAPNGPCSLWLYGYTGTTGYAIPGWSIKPVESGVVVPVNLPLQAARNADGTALGAAATVGGFGFTQIAGSASFLLGESAQGNTKTDAVTWEVVLPGDYVAGRDLTVTARAYFQSTGTAGATKTLTLTAYRINSADSTHGANIGPGAAVLTNVATDHALTVAGATLAPGDRVLLRLTAALQETGGANPLQARINSVRIG